jgi:predicted MPP superfamily phosphohydrolase
VNRVVVRVPNLHPDLQGFTIAQISDLHIGATIRANYVEAVAKQVNDLQPHMIAVTGDLADGFVQNLLADVAPLKTLTAQHGVFYIAGNHEYYWDGPAWIEYVQKELAWTYLGNEHRVINHGAAQIAVAGTIDIGAKRFFPTELSNPKKAIEGAPLNAFRLLLAHQPVVAFDASKENYHLQISGHTHGGQFWPWTWVIHAIQPFVKGFYRVGNMQLYVNRGTGYWGPPARLGARGEITLFTLEAEV